jgi:hypothetical protein
VCYLLPHTHPIPRLSPPSWFYHPNTLVGSTKHAASNNAVFSDLMLLPWHPIGQHPQPTLFPFVLISLTSPSTKTYFEDSLLLLKYFLSHSSQGTEKNCQFLSWRIVNAAVAKQVMRGPQSNDDFLPRFPKFVLEFYELLTNGASRRMRGVWYLAVREVQ